MTRRVFTFLVLLFCGKKRKIFLNFLGKILKIKKFLLTLCQETILTTVNQNCKTMDAPIDIVISIIKRKMTETENRTANLTDYEKGKVDAYRGLIEEFEGFKKLFN